jgi:hypothetical protein
MRNINLHELTIEQLHELNRDELVALLVRHDKDGDYLDLNHQEALNVSVINLYEVKKMTHTILNKKHDCKIVITLKVGDNESIDTIEELITYELDTNPNLKKGYVESYPFFKADWEITQ